MRLLPVVALSAVLAACSSGSDGSGGPSRTVTLGAPGAVGSNTGSVGFQLTLPTGQQIPVLSWAVSGPNGLSAVVQSGTLTAQSAGVTFLVGNLPVASGYKVSLGGTADDGSVVCAGSANFAIVTRMTTDVVVELACSTATQGSHVTLVNGTSFNCAAWGNVSASPTETTVGGQIMLSATATGPSPGNITYGWSSPSGTFGNGSAANTTFTCTAVGPVNVTLVVGDGPVPSGNSCNASLDTRTVVIQCAAVGGGDSGAGDAGGGDAGGGDAGAGDAGGGDGGPPPPPAPALPPWAALALGAALVGMGSLASRRLAGRER